MASNAAKPLRIAIAWSNSLRIFACATCGPLWNRATKTCRVLTKPALKMKPHPFGDARFSGFDGNNELEYISVARFLIDHLDSFTDFKGRDLDSSYAID